LFFVFVFVVVQVRMQRHVTHFRFAPARVHKPYFSSLRNANATDGTEWLLTLFTYKGIPASTSARIWDFIFVDGADAVVRVVVAFLKLRFVFVVLVRQTSVVTGLIFWFSRTSHISHM
jgi:hypothetical protein